MNIYRRCKKKVSTFSTLCVHLNQQQIGIRLFVETLYVSISI